MNNETKLIDIIRNLKDFDPYLTIYAQPSPRGEWSEQSVAIVAQDVNGYAPEQIAKRGFKYFLEIFITNEIIEDWIAIKKTTSDNVESIESLCAMVIFYAENDCYPNP